MNNEEKILDLLAMMQVHLNAMDSRFDSIDGRMDSIENQITKTNIKLETEIAPKLDILFEGHASILEQLTPRSRVDELENKVLLLEAIVRRMNDDLIQLKQAQ